MAAPLPPPLPVPVAPEPLPAPKPPKRRPGNPAMQKGMPSLNPSGRPSSFGEMRKQARAWAEKVIAGLAEIAVGVDAEGQYLAPAAARAVAMKELLDRGFGKAVQPVELGGPGAFDMLDDAAMDDQAEVLALMVIEQRRGRGGAG